MKILHIISGLKSGGAENILFRLCEHDKEFRHVIISLTDFQDDEMVFNQEMICAFKSSMSFLVDSMMETVSYASGGGIMTGKPSYQVQTEKFSSF